MQDFHSPGHILKFKKFNENCLSNKPKVFDSIPFHSIHFLSPSNESFTDKFKQLLVTEENTYFLARKIPVTSLIQSTFLENFVRKGTLCAVSNNTTGDVGNNLAITLSGKLIVQLENNIAGYLSLLKEKSPKCHIKEAKTHQTCVIDICSDEFLPEKKLYKSVLSELQKIDHIKFDLLFKWIPKGNICCESLRDYFESQGYECDSCEPQLKVETKFDAPIPQLNFKDMDKDTMESVVEWSGAQLCGIEYAEEKDEYVSKFYHPGLSEKGKLYISSFQGFYTTHEINKALETTKSCFVSDSSLPFVAVLLSGFQQCYVDSPELRKFSSDDKLICLFIFPDSKILMCTLNL